MDGHLLSPAFCPEANMGKALQRENCFSFQVLGGISKDPVSLQAVVCLHFSFSEDLVYNLFLPHLEAKVDRIFWAYAQNL